MLKPIFKQIVLKNGWIIPQPLCPKCKGEIEAADDAPMEYYTDYTFVCKNKDCDYVYR